MKTKNIIFLIINIMIVTLVLFSYYLKKNIGYVFYTWIMYVFFIIVIIYSILLSISEKKRIVYISQIILCLFFFLNLRLDISDRFALLIEVPKKEKIIKEIENGAIPSNAILSDDYILFEWEPGFLDYQWVLVYDKQDKLKETNDNQLYISEGKLYILYQAKKCFYLCILYR